MSTSTTKTSSNDDTSTKMVLSSKLYDILKLITSLILPAVATLYGGLVAIWHLPYGTEIVGSITALNTALGFIISRSTRNYANITDGTLNVDTSDPEKDVYSLEVDGALDTLAKKDTITLEVKKISQ